MWDSYYELTPPAVNMFVLVVKSFKIIQRQHLWRCISDWNRPNAWLRRNELVLSPLFVLFVPRDLVRTGSGWRCASQIQPAENFKPFCWKQYLAHPWQMGKELKTEASVCNYIKSNGRILPLVTILQFSHRKNSIHSEFAKIFFYRTMLEKFLKLSKYDERLVVSIFSERHVQLVQKSSS